MLHLLKFPYSTSGIMRINKNHHFDLIGFEQFLKLLEVNVKVKQTILILFRLKLILDYFSLFYIESEQKSIICRRENEYLILLVC